METVIKVLEGVHSLSDEVKEYLKAHLRCKEIKRKELLLKAGHVCRNIYFIEKGLLRCYYLQGEQEVSSWFMKEGDVIASVNSFFEQKESYESIQALEDGVLHYITYEELQHIYRHFPEFNFIGRELVQKYYQLSERRLYSLRMQRGLERFEALKKDHPELVQRVEQKYLASYLGITEQYLSMIKGVKTGRHFISSKS